MAKTRDEQDAYLTDYIGQCWTEYDEATADRREQWSELWLCYQNKQDWTNKMSWQSKIFIPKVWMHVERASGEVRRAMLQTQKLFKLELNDARERANLSRLYRDRSKTGSDVNKLGEILQKIDRARQDLKDQNIQMRLDDSRFKADLATTNLAAVYSEMCKVAFLLGIGIPKVGWNRRQMKVVYKNIDPFNVAICPDWEPTQEDPPEYIIERETMRLSRLYEMAKKANEEAGSKIFDLNAIKEIKEDYTSDEQQEQDERKGINPRLLSQGKVELKYFWGDVPKEDHTGYDKQRRFVVIANDSYIIRNGPNPFKHGRPPYIPTMPLAYPFRGHSGTSLVEPIVKMNYAYNNILNLFIDNLNFAVNKQFQIDPQELRDPRQMTSVYPGKLWKVKSNQNAAPVVREIPVNAAGAEALQALSALGKDVQEATGVTEFLQGTTGGRKTATEVEIKTMESRGLFDIIAKEMEQYSLKPLLEMSYDLYEQFADYPPRNDKYQISVGGVSLILAQKQLMEALMTTIGLVMKVPPLAQMTDMGDLYQRFLSASNLSDVYKEPPEAQMDPLTMEQTNAIHQKAAMDAKQMVAQMTPEQKAQLMGAMPQGQPQGQPMQPPMQGQPMPQGAM